MRTKAVPLRKGEDVLGYYIWCVGCKHVHFFPTSLKYYEQSERLQKAERKPVWNFSGTLDKPTFSPSLREYYWRPPEGTEVTICHIIVTDGRVQFCPDCPHALANQTLELELIPDNYGLPPGTEQ
jgi:hypothetical protein